ncbi:hypothetical protein TRAPUB_2273 [Trametes pubescens]|uniref:Uncharacterized protein n=1 Tax=Trametes pubescens TaxID=154538 RepID=A0A1M2VH65_TRAPU|nr:hypothetical protein TRAPUB_2273 [Trametes pubescens]
MPFTKAQMVLRVDTWSSPTLRSPEYSVSLTVYAYDSDEVFTFNLPTFNYGHIVVLLCDRWLRIVRGTMLPNNFVSEEQAALLIDLFLIFRANTTQSPGVDDDTLSELVIQLVEGALSQSEGDRADEAIAVAVLWMQFLLPAALFHDPTDLFALTSAELIRNNPSALRRVHAAPPPIDTQPIARSAPHPIGNNTADRRSLRNDQSVHRDDLAPRGCATANTADSNDDMPPLVSPTSAELEIGDF